MLRGVVVSVLSAVLILASMPVLSLQEDMRGDSSENFSTTGLKVIVQSPKGRYTAGDKIPLEISVINKGYYPVTIFLHKHARKNFTVIARTAEGKSLPLKNEYLPETEDENYYGSYTATNFHSRAVVLRPGEKFTHNFNLDDFVFLPEKLESEKEQISINAYFYPNPEQAPRVFAIADNFVHLILDQKTMEQPEQQFFAKESDGYPDPGETIYLLLSAEYTLNWPRYFKYVSLGDIIRDYPEFARSYMNAGQNERTYVLDNFRRYLMSRGKLKKFTIVSQTIDDNGTSEVKARVLRNFEGFEREFLYTYYLSKKDPVWKVTGIQTQVEK